MICVKCISVIILFCRNLLFCHILQLLVLVLLAYFSILIMQKYHNSIGYCLVCVVLDILTRIYTRKKRLLYDRILYVWLYLTWHGFVNLDRLDKLLEWKATFVKQGEKTYGIDVLCVWQNEIILYLLQILTKKVFLILCNGSSKESPSWVHNYILSILYFLSLPL